MIKLIRKLDATITPFHDVSLFHTFFGVPVEKSVGLEGYDGFIFKNVYNSFGAEADQENRTITIKSGMGIAFGRQFELADSETIVFSLGFLNGIKYVLIYAEINTLDPTNEKVSFKMAYAGSSYPIIKGQNLIETPNGIARIPLWKAMYTASGSVHISNLTRLAPLEDPSGAENTRTLQLSSYIATSLVSTLFPISDSFTYAINEAKRGNYLVKALEANSVYTSESVGDEANENQVSNSGMKLTTKNAYLLRTASYEVDTGSMFPAVNRWLCKEFDSNGVYVQKEDTDMYFVLKDLPANSTILAVQIGGKITIRRRTLLAYESWRNLCDDSEYIYMASRLTGQPTPFSFFNQNSLNGLVAKNGSQIKLTNYGLNLNTINDANYNAGYLWFDLANKKLYIHMNKLVIEGYEAWSHLYVNIIFVTE